MNAPTRQTPDRPRRHAFTLVEILVVIVIIGILMAIAIPAIMAAINRGNTVAMKMEVNSLADAVSQYQQKYGDYPPDFSDWTVVERHYRKIFPRISPVELLRLQVLLDDTPGNDTEIDANLSSVVSTHNPVRMDRGEVLAWTLGGYSDNPSFPFTGPGGPLELIVDTTMEKVYQMNIDRNNKLFDFQPERMDFSEITPAAAPSATNRYYSTLDSNPATGDIDLFPSYFATDTKPFVYFDSRTYADWDPNYPRVDSGTGDYNAYGVVISATEVDVVRPYFSNNANPNTSGAAYGSLDNALQAWDYMNPDTFQIIAPGLDGRYGSVPYFEFDGSNSIAEPLYFQYPTGSALVPSSAATAPGQLVLSGVRGYQERVPVAQGGLGATDNFQLDNLTNFADSSLVDDYEP